MIAGVAANILPSPARVIFNHYYNTKSFNYYYKDFTNVCPKGIY